MTAEEIAALIAHAERLHRKLETAHAVATMQGDAIRRWEADCKRHREALTVLVGYLDAMEVAAHTGGWRNNLRANGAADTVDLIGNLL